MDKNTAGCTANNLLNVAVKYATLLHQIRHWHNLTVAVDKETFWIQGFSEEQWTSLTLKGIPFAVRFEQKGEWLFPEGKLLPHQKFPLLDWKPIGAVMVVSLPAYNNNYFGINEMLEIELIPDDSEQPVIAITTTMDMLYTYTKTAIAIRLKELKWCLFSDEKVLVVGYPLLPVSGEAYWQSEGFLMPAGYNFELPILKNILEKRLNENNDNWIMWQKEGLYITIPKMALQELTHSSVRLTKESFIQQ